MANHKKAGSDRRPFGELETRASGRTRARYVRPDTKQKYSRMFDDRTYAERWLANEKILIDTDAWTPPEVRMAAASITVNEYAQAQLASRDISPNYRTECERYLERFVTEDSLGEMPIRAVTPADVTIWLAAVRGSTGKVMAARVYGFVSSVFNAAVEEDVIPSSPFRIKGASQAKRISPKTSATPQEVAAVLAYLPETYRALVLVAAWAGTRSGEIRNLRRQHVNLKAGSITLERQVQNVRGQGKVVRDLKTKAAHRTVFLPAHVAAELRAQVKRVGFTGRDGLIFPSSKGTPISPSTLWEVWDRARRKIGRPDLRFHDLRHTAAMLAIGAGATVSELQAQLGHETPSAAMKYLHAAAGSSQRIAAALDRAVAAGLLDEEDDAEAQQDAR